jgi:hypothetical protein
MHMSISLHSLMYRVPLRRLCLHDVSHKFITERRHNVVYYSTLSNNSFLNYGVYLNFNFYFKFYFRFYRFIPCYVAALRCQKSYGRHSVISSEDISA